jgi:hypothetical protein
MLIGFVSATNAREVFGEDVHAELGIPDGNIWKLTLIAVENLV